MELSWTQTLKLFLMQLTALSRDALHVYAGMLIFLVSAAMFRKKLHSLVPWLLVLVVACGMEAIDSRDDVRLFGHWRLGESLHDILNTLFWPTVVLLVCRYTNLACRSR